MNPIAVLFAVIISALAVPAVYTAMSSQQQQELSTAAAIQMARVEKAAEAYITANAGAIEGVATGSSPAVITISMLENAGYLPNGFSSVNPFDQQWEVEVLQPTSGNLQALVVSYGGNAVNAQVAGQVAQIAGATGGVIGGGSGEYAVPGCNGGEACGAYGGWSVFTSGYQNIQPGHFAALLAYSNGQLQSDYLYRVAVPGQPQLNQMQTNLDMGANNINNAENVNVNDDVTLGNPGAATGGSTASFPGQLGVNEPAGQGFPSGWGGGIHTWDEYANGTISTGENGYQATNMNGFGNVGNMSLQDQSNGNYVGINTGNTGSNPEVYTNGTISAGENVSAGVPGTPEDGYCQTDADGHCVGQISAAGQSENDLPGGWWGGIISRDVYATATIGAGTNNQVSAYLNSGGYMAAGYEMILGSANGRANVGWGCGPDGSIAANANGSGQILACEGGTWQPMGGTTGYPGVNVIQFGAGGNGTAYLGNYIFCAGDGLYAPSGTDVIYPSGGMNGSGQYAWFVSWSGVAGIRAICFN